jgi:hypothetical protein
MNSVDEFLVKDFEQICSILNNKEKQSFQKWSEVFIYLGLPENIVDDFDAAAFISIIKEFNIQSKLETEIKKEIELDGIKYQAFDEKFKLTVKETALIEGYIAKNDNRYLGEILAVIYKRQDITKDMHYDKAHIHYKAELIRKEITADVAVPLINFMSKRLINDFAMIENDVKNG